MRLVTTEENWISSTAAYVRFIESKMSVAFTDVSPEKETGERGVHAPAEAHFRLERRKEGREVRMCRQPFSGLLLLLGHRLHWQ